MFTILSNEAKLMSIVRQATTEEHVEIKRNFEQIIELLSAPVAELLANRRHCGVLLPQVSANITHSNDVSENTTIGLSVLLNQASLIQCINMLCLTEAVIVRDNFDNCLELPAFSAMKKNDIANVNETSSDITQAEEGVPTSKNNISPIRINEVKNRLTQAILSPEQQKVAIKNKLNALLIKTDTTEAQAQA